MIQLQTGTISLESLALLVVMVLALAWIIMLLVGIVAGGWFGILPLLALALTGFFVWRLLSDRMCNPDDSRYDRIKC